MLGDEEQQFVGIFIQISKISFMTTIWIFNKCILGILHWYVCSSWGGGAVKYTPNAPKEWAMKRGKNHCSLRMHRREKNHACT